MWTVLSRKVELATGEGKQVQDRASTGYPQHDTPFACKRGSQESLLRLLLPSGRHGHPVSGFRASSLGTTCHPLVHSGGRHGVQLMPGLGVDLLRDHRDQHVLVSPAHHHIQGVLPSDDITHIVG